MIMAFHALPKVKGGEVYSRIARAKFDTTKSAEVVKVAQDSVATFQRLPGFQSVAFHYDRSSGWGIAVSLWDTKEHADAVPEGTKDVVAAFAIHRANRHQPTDTLEGALATFEVIAQG